ncbi:MAG: InlB B-repeat-containing protein, partial [Anaerolineae bacterium]|nr:InlB B-repeat-containing protein [Anaerolineae bacterium]
AYAIVEGDFNNDSKLDFAVSNYGSNTVGIFLGNLPLCYDGNGSDGGSAPVDGSSPYAPGATVTVLDNTGSLVKTGYTFAGWNTAADGSGTSYVPAATFNITSPTILYAQWTVVVAPGVAGGDGPGGVGVTDGSSALALWLRPDRGVYIDAGCSTAAANGQDVACWQDQSGNSQDVMGLASTRRPTYNTAVLNGMPVLAYVGGDGGDVLTRTFASFASGGNQPYTIFSAFNPSNTNLENLFAIGVPVLDQNIAYHPYWSGLNNGRALYHYGDDLSVAGTVSGWQFAAFRYTAGTGTNQYYYDRSSLAGSRQTSAALNLPVNPILSVGGYDNRTGINGSELTGSIGEMIIFSQALTDVERILVENYLSAKYNIAMSANDVYDGDDSGSGDFDLDMAGIGRYDGSSHTQAHSVGLIVVNRTFLGDNGDWLTFGHPTPANSKTTADLPTSGDWASAPNPMRWARHWYFDLTDANTNGGTVDIIFDFSEGGMGGQSPSGQASNYRLLKRSGTSGQFSDIATASAIVGDQVQFLGVDVTLLGSNFTIGTLDNTNSPLGNPPTAVTLTAFTAEWDGDEVVVTWETALEIDTVGFNLWRSTDGGAYEQVNASLIPAASPGGVMGGTYEYVDAGVTPGKMYTYKLEELEVGSARNWYGPVSTGGSSYTTVKMKAFAVGEPQWLPAAGLAVAAALGVALVKRRRRA